LVGSIYFKPAIGPFGQSVSSIQQVLMSPAATVRGEINKVRSKKNDATFVEEIM